MSDTIQYTSQKGQDKWVIEEIFKGKEKGFFVDLAATDGIKLSNTYIIVPYSFLFCSSLDKITNIN